MIRDLYLIEQERLRNDPNYHGGGLKPPYGPRVNYADYMTFHGTLPDRQYYSTLLMAEYNRLKYQASQR